MSILVLCAAAAACSGGGEAHMGASGQDLLARKPDEVLGAGPLQPLGARGSGARLPAGAEVRWRVQLLAPSTLALAVEARGAGSLEIAQLALDPATGAEEPLARTALALSRGEELERELALEGGDRPVELRLAWRASDAGAELELRQLRLAEAVPCARPSIVLVVVDTLSARHLTPYGYPLQTSPALQRLASESYLFERCLTNAPWTLPSFMALMSGVYGAAHEIRAPGKEGYEHWKLAPSRWTMAEFLHAAGYRTGAFVDHVWLTEPFGFAQGFDTYDKSAADDNGNKRFAFEGGIRHATARARAFLEGLDEDAPFFLFLHAFDVHGPYTAPREGEPVLGDALPYDQGRTAPAGGPASAWGIIPTYIARGEVPQGPLPSPMHTAPIERSYDESIRLMDEGLDAFLGHLRERGLLEHTWVIVTADHGETSADGRLLFGHGVLDQDVVHVPLLMRPPGGFPGGRRIAEPVQLVDLYPTLAELVGWRAGGAHVHGRSLLPLLEGGATLGPRALLCEGGILRQALLVAGDWALVEYERAQDSSTESLLSDPQVSRAWFEEVERSVRERLAAVDAAPDGRTPEEREVRLFGWKADAELLDDLFEVLPRTGVTEELMVRMRTRPGFESLDRFLRRVFQDTSRELYHLSEDPRAEHDLAAAHPDKVAELVQLLRRERERRKAATNGEGTHAVLPAAEVEQLKGLGY